MNGYGWIDVLIRRWLAPLQLVKGGFIQALSQMTWLTWLLKQELFLAWLTVGSDRGIGQDITQRSRCRKDGVVFHSLVKLYCYKYVLRYKDVWNSREKSICCHLKARNNSLVLQFMKWMLMTPCFIFLDKKVFVWQEKSAILEEWKAMKSDVDSVDLFSKHPRQKVSPTDVQRNREPPTGNQWHRRPSNLAQVRLSLDILSLRVKSSPLTVPHKQALF